MSPKKILSFVIGIALSTFLLKKMFSLFSNTGKFDFDISLEANPSPPARKSWYS